MLSNWYVSSRVMPRIVTLQLNDPLSFWLRHKNCKVLLWVIPSLEVDEWMLIPLSFVMGPLGPVQSIFTILLSSFPLIWMLHSILKFCPTVALPVEPCIEIVKFGTVKCKCTKIHYIYVVANCIAESLVRNKDDEFYHFEYMANKVSQMNS